ASWTTNGGPVQTFGPLNFKYSTPTPPPPGTVQFKSATYSIGEGGGSVRVYVSRIGGSAGTASVNYATAGGTAAADIDYVPASGVLSWPDQDATDRFFDVSIVIDVEPEANETFTASLNSPVRVSVASPASTSITITSSTPALVLG